MLLLQFFLSFLSGLLLLLILGGVFNVTNKLYAALSVSSMISGFLLFVFSAIGYKFVIISTFSYFLCGFFGVFGLIVVVILKMLV